jgi:hypothetical protein
MLDMHALDAYPLINLFHVKREISPSETLELVVYIFLLYDVNKRNISASYFNRWGY